MTGEQRKLSRERWEDVMAELEHLFTYGEGPILVIAVGRGEEARRALAGELARRMPSGLAFREFVITPEDLNPFVDFQRGLDRGRFVTLVYGLESLEPGPLKRALALMNWNRSQLDRGALRMVLWVEPEILPQLYRYAGDFADWWTDFVDIPELDPMVEERRREADPGRHRHAVLLDGMPAAGKTTFLWSATCPSGRDGEPPQERSTQPSWSALVPVVPKESGGRELVHVLEFFDHPGERPDLLIDGLMDYGGRPARSRGAAVALVIWDLAAGLDRNLEYLSPAHMRTLYGSRLARERLSHILFFLNKCDLVSDLASTVAAHGQAIRRLHKISFPAYAEPEIVVGSALTGAGVQECLRLILRHLGLDGASLGL